MAAGELWELWARQSSTPRKGFRNTAAAGTGRSGEERFRGNWEVAESFGDTMLGVEWVYAELTWGGREGGSWEQEGDALRGWGEWDREGEM